MNQNQPPEDQMNDTDNTDNTDSSPIQSGPAKLDLPEPVPTPETAVVEPNPEVDQHWRYFTVDHDGDASKLIRRLEAENEPVFKEWKTLRRLYHADFYSYQTLPDGAQTVKGFCFKPDNDALSSVNRALVKHGKVVERWTDDSGGKHFLPVYVPNTRKDAGKLLARRLERLRTHGRQEFTARLCIDWAPDEIAAAPAITAYRRFDGRMPPLTTVVVVSVPKLYGGALVEGLTPISTALYRGMLATDDEPADE